jgi:hypothetical protein
MNDSKALFHAYHGNLAAAGAVISIDTIGAGRLSMAKQTGLDGKDGPQPRPSVPHHSEGAPD